MKKITMFLLIVVLTLNANAQTINANPDSTGTPWIVGKIPEYTAEIIAELNAIPELELTDTSSQTPLPSLVDNSLQKYMRPIFPQQGKSCAAAAGIGYNFTYEINRLRNIDVSDENDSLNFYPTHFTYNFLNLGTDNGSLITDCWNIVIEQGCPTVPVWQGMAGDYKKWMSGYDKYDTSFYNKIKSYSKITVTDSSKLNILKHWISDHNEGDSIGGLCNFKANIVGLGYIADQFPEGSPEENKWLMVRFPYYGDTRKHAFTIVGYNDSVRYDFNGDSTFTNNIDINNDNIVDIRDWEFGAVKVANSWGVEDYMDSGYVYVPYRLLAESSDTGGIILNHVYVIHLDTAKKYYKPDFLFKIKMKHPYRNSLSFYLGHSLTSCYNSPTELKKNFPFSEHSGGPLSMQGINDDPIEFELDFSYYFSNLFNNQHKNFGKVFLKICERSATVDTATIYEFSLVDYRWDEEFELTYNNVPMEFYSGQDTILMGIEYDLIPFEIDHPVTYKYACNKICRLHCEIIDSSEVKFGSGINVDFYNGSITIEEGSTLTIQDSATLHAKTGADSLIVYGDIQIGDHVCFIAEQNASFVIDIRNPDLQLDINKAYFENIKLTAYNDSLSIDSCEFIHSNFDFYRVSDEYLVVSNSVFDTTTFNATVDETSIKDKGNLTISDCEFVTDLEDGPMNINVYKNFVLLRDSIVFNSGDGISLTNSGSSSAQTSKIECCYIYFRGNASEDTSRGINIYHSYAALENNHVFNCTYGVACLDRSNVSLSGNELADEENETQQIVNNEINQVYALEGSFPYEFEYNAIYNESNDDSLVYYNTTYSPSGKFLDVKNNYWGVNGLDTVYGLIPTLKYYWDPVWDPWSHKSTPEDRLLFYAAKQSIESGNYADAEGNFKEIIEDHSGSKYIKASVKELLVLKRIHDQDFAGLQSYLDSVPTLWDDAITANVTDHVINWCNIEKEEYASAILWFEDQISNPNSYEDSICAIIDLGYTYTLMDTTSNKASGYICNYPQYIPVSHKAYEKKREYLIDLLFRTKSHSDNEHPKPQQPATCNMQQNFPNPATETTTINYKITEQSHVLLVLYNTQGSLVKTLVDETQNKGQKTFTVNINELSNGIYYYLLKLDNEVIGVKKMVVMQ